MANQDPFRFRGHYGEYGAPGLLPNVAGSPNQTRNLAPGDIAYVTTVGLYLCVNATRGAATWDLIGGTGGSTAGGTVELYVAGDTGSDTNPGTQAAPLQTLTEALQRVPRTLLRTYNIHLATATNPYDGDFLLGNSWDCAGGSLHIIGDDSTVLTSGTAQAGSTNVNLVTTGGHTVDEFIGKTLSIIMTGNWSGRICKKTIIQNDTTTLRTTVAPYDDPTFTGISFATGDAYQVTEPAVEIAFHGGQIGGARNMNKGGYAAAFSSGVVHTMRMFNLRFVAAAGAGVVNIGPYGDFTLYGCEFSSNTFAVTPPKAGAECMHGSLISDPNQSAIISFDGSDIDRQGQLTGWGYYADRGFSSPDRFIGYICCQGISGPRSDQDLVLLGGRIYGYAASPVGGIEVGLRDSSTLGGGGRVTIGGPFFSNINARLLIQELAGNTFLEALIRVNGTAFLGLGSTGYLSTAVANVDGVYADGAFAYLGMDRTISATRYGVRSRGGARIVLENNANISGTVANFAAGETPQTAASVSRGTPLQSTTPADGSYVGIVD